jgi:hypothetical protein
LPSARRQARSVSGRPEADFLLRLAGMFDELAGKPPRRPNETDETRLMAFTRPASPRT